MSRLDLTRRIPELDGLRGLAIAMVMYFHFVVETPAKYPALVLWFNTKVGCLCWSGVDLFFVLSGFLIGGILLDNEGSPSYFRTFYLRRAFRILPLYLLILLLYATIHSAGDGIRAALTFLVHGPMPWYVYATFTQDIWQVFHSQSVFLEHTWSLSIEEQFYLTLPLVIYLTPRRHVAAVIACLTAAAIASRFFLYDTRGYFDNAQMMYFPSCRVDSLLIGVACAIAVRNNHLREMLSRRSEFLYMGCATAIVSIFLLIGSRPGLPPPSFTLTMIAIACASALLLAVLHPAAILSTVLRFRPLQALGKIAYGLYLVHVIVKDAFIQVLNVQIRKGTVTSWSTVWIVIGLEFVVSVAIAAISWHALEKQCIKFSRRWAYTDGASVVHAAENRVSI